MSSLYGNKSQNGIIRLPHCRESDYCMNILKKSLLGFLAFFISATSIFAAPAMAQSSPWYAPTLEDFNSKVSGAPENEIFGERYTQAQIYWILYSIVNFAIGQGVTGCTEDPTQAISCIQNIFGGASGTIPGVSQDQGIILPLAFLVDKTIQYRPASGVGYIASQLDKLNVVDNVYAQEGFGYGTLSPTVPLWGAVRNASYALMVVAIIILAFMIMFRTKISPQASLTVQVAIPRIVMALVLITFSYAIAGFLIDLAYLVLGLIGALFGVSGVSSLNPGQMFGALQSWGNGMLSLGVIFILFLLVPSAVAIWIPVAAIPAVIAAILIAILVLIVYLVALIKILWVMFRSMLIITMLTIFSPLYILWGVVSSGGGIGPWVKMYIGHLSVFVTIPLFIFLANVVWWGSVGPTSGSIIDPSTWSFINPYGVNTTLLAGGIALPGFFGGFNPIFGLIGALILLLSSSKLASGIRDQIITGRAQFGADTSAIGGAFGIIGMGSQGYTDARIASAETRAKFAKGPKATAAATREKQQWQRVQGGIQSITKRLG